MKMLHHVCLIPFCIIDMNYWYDSCKVFFKQLNNLLMSMLPQCVPDLDKKKEKKRREKIPPHFFSFILWDSHWLEGLFVFELVKWRDLPCVVLWTKMKKQRLVLRYKRLNKIKIRPQLYWSSCGWPHINKIITQGSKWDKFDKFVTFTMFHSSIWNSTLYLYAKATPNNWSV